VNRLDLSSGQGHLYEFSGGSVMADRSTPTPALPLKGGGGIAPVDVPYTVSKALATRASDPQ
jgi:hypothetical protein